MKIKIISKKLSGKGGTEIVIRNMMQQLPMYFKEANMSLTIIDSVPDKRWLQGMKNIKTRNTLTIPILEKVGSFTFLLRHLIFSTDEVILGTSPMIISVASMIKRLFRKKYQVISWIHHSLNSEYLEGKQQKILEADYHFVIASGIAEQFEALQGHQKNVFTIYNPISFTSDSIESSTIPTFVSVGRLVKEPKNHMELLRAATLLPKDKEWKIEFYGDGNYKEILEEFVNQNQLTDRIEFKGWVQNPWEEIKEATALVLTSKYEGFGMVLGEAISRGLPCISSNCPTGPSDIINEDNGFLYKLGNEKQLSELMTLFINHKIEYPEIKQSISKLYEDRYYERIKANLIQICSNKR